MVDWLHKLRVQSVMLPKKSRTRSMDREEAAVTFPGVRATLSPSTLKPRSRRASFDISPTSSKPVSKESSPRLLSSSSSQNRKALLAKIPRPLSNTTNVKVVCRIRPLNATENQSGLGECLSCEDNSTVEWVETNERFQYDYVFDENSTQQEFFEKVALPHIDDVLQGFNAAVIAFGNRSSGKTFTMMGSEHEGERRGVVSSIMEQLVRVADKMGVEGDCRLMLSCQCVRIHGDTVTDGFGTPKTTNENLSTFTSLDITDPQSIRQIMFSIFNPFPINRTDEDTQRFHTVIILNVRQHNGRDMTTRKSSLFLADLASTEQGTDIADRNLVALFKVVDLLADFKAKDAVVPYADSHLTRILKEALGGKWKSTFVLNCSPSQMHHEETVATLSFGLKAKKIQNEPIINKDTPLSDESKLAIRSTASEPRTDATALQALLKAATQAQDMSRQELDRKRQQVEDYRETIKHLTAELDAHKTSSQEKEEEERASKQALAEELQQLNLSMNQLRTELDSWKSKCEILENQLAEQADAQRHLKDLLANIETDTISILSKNSTDVGTPTESFSGQFFIGDKEVSATYVESVEKIAELRTELLRSRSAKEDAMLMLQQFQQVHIQEKEELMNQIEREKALHETTRQQLIQLEKLIEDRKAAELHKNEELMQKYNTLKDSFNVKSNGYKEIQTKMEELNATIHSLEEYKVTVNLKNEKLSGRNLALKTSVDNLTTQVEQLQEEKSSLQGALETMEMRLQQERQRVSQFEKEEEQRNIRRMCQSPSLHDLHILGSPVQESNQVLDMQTKLSTTEQDLVNATSKLETKERKLSEFKAELIRVMEHNEELQDSLKKERLATSQITSQFENVLNGIEEVKNVRQSEYMAELEKAREDYQQLLQTVQQSQTAQETVVHQLQDQIKREQETAQGRIKTLEDELRSEQAVNQQLREEGSVKESEKMKLGQEITHLQEKVAEMLSAEELERQQRTQTIDSRWSQLSEQVQSLQHELAHQSKSELASAFSTFNDELKANWLEIRQSTIAQEQSSSTTEAMVRDFTDMLRKRKERAVTPEHLLSIMTAVCAILLCVLFFFIFIASGSRDGTHLVPSYT
eukprot:GILJ01011901.1.p1 GENE.GILJ01011901.1~~GILJ01011901.1.p1  ORF type:complete len:1098 (+),score=197.33 GILJ01011901.1:109-3402(+)